MSATDSLISKVRQLKIKWIRNLRKLKANTLEMKNFTIATLIKQIMFARNSCMSFRFLDEDGTSSSKTPYNHKAYSIGIVKFFIIR